MSKIPFHMIVTSPTKTKSPGNISWNNPIFSGKNILVETDVGRRGLWAYWSIPSIKITYNWYMRRSCLFSICLHFAAFCLFYENFWVEKKFSDMVHGFHSDYHEKMQSEIAIHSFLHHIEIHGPCQTLLIFSICFLSLSWRHGPQNNFPWSSHPKWKD